MCKDISLSSSCQDYYNKPRRTYYVVTTSRGAASRRLLSHSSEKRNERADDSECWKSERQSCCCCSTHSFVWCFYVHTYIYSLIRKQKWQSLQLHMGITYIYNGFCTPACFRKCLVFSANLASRHFAGPKTDNRHYLMKVLIMHCAIHCRYKFC